LSIGLLAIALLLFRLLHFCTLGFCTFVLLTSALDGILEPCRNIYFQDSKISKEKSKKLIDILFSCDKL